MYISCTTMYHAHHARPPVLDLYLDLYWLNRPPVNASSTIQPTIRPCTTKMYSTQKQPTVPKTDQKHTATKIDCTVMYVAKIDLLYACQPPSRLAGQRRLYPPVRQLVRSPAWPAPAPDHRHWPTRPPARQNTTILHHASMYVVPAVRHPRCTDDVPTMLPISFMPVPSCTAWQHLHLPACLFNAQRSITTFRPEQRPARCRVWQVIPKANAFHKVSPHSAHSGWHVPEWKKPQKGLELYVVHLYHFRSASKNMYHSHVPSGAGTGKRCTVACTLFDDVQDHQVPTDA